MDKVKLLLICLWALLPVLAFIDTFSGLNTFLGYILVCAIELSFLTAGVFIGRTTKEVRV